MARERLSNLDNWELENKDQDIRGDTLYGPDGKPIGKVDDLIVDTDRELIVAIVLENGKMYAADSFEFRDGKPVLLAKTRESTVREEAERTMTLQEERLRARKERAKTGEVEIHKKVVSEEQSMDVPVTREEVHIERRKVDRAVPSDRPIGEDETITVPIYEERVTPEKETVVSEEIEIGKRNVQDTERVSGTVRRERADIEREGDVDVDERGQPRGRERHPRDRT
jgi:uncharacterized protein (TIGR02271 family)